jgi:hypothetical protein
LKHAFLLAIERGEIIYHGDDYIITHPIETQSLDGTPAGFTAWVELPAGPHAAYSITEL